MTAAAVVISLALLASASVVITWRTTSDDLAHLLTDVDLEGGGR
ncbi:MAG TPA: hypothetical protein VIK91_16520 [Nannocystis sp.]|mgnify:CR=1 FL=1